MNTPEVYRLNPPETPLDEVLRYMGAKHAGTSVCQLAKNALQTVQSAAQCKACFLRLPLLRSDKTIQAGPLVLKSAGLVKNLKGCAEVFLFAATLGHAVDREIASAALLSPAKALALDAAATALIEAVCDAICARLSACAESPLRPRFSPGYGDLPLSSQKPIAELLRMAPLLGASLSPDCIFRPAKTVTAFAGIYHEVTKS